MSEDTMRVDDMWTGDSALSQEARGRGEVAVSVQQGDEIALNLIADGDGPAASVYMTTVQAVVLSERLKAAAEESVRVMRS